MPRLLECLPSARSEDVEEGAERRESSEGVRLRELSRFLRGSALLELRNRRTEELRLLEVRTGSLSACCWSRVVLDSFLSRRPSLVAEGSLRTEEGGAFESSLAMTFFCSFLLLRPPRRIRQRRVGGFPRLRSFRHARIHRFAPTSVPAAIFIDRGVLADLGGGTTPSFASAFTTLTTNDWNGQRRRR